MKASEGRFPCVEKLSLFRGISSTMSERLAEAAVEQEFCAGSWMLRQFDIADRFFVLTHGTLQFHIDSGAGNLALGDADEFGALLGWSVFRKPYRYTASVRCSSSTTALCWQKSTIDTFIEQEPSFGVLLMQRVAEAIMLRLERTREKLQMPRAVVDQDSSRPLHIQLNDTDNNDFERLHQGVSTLGHQLRSVRTQYITQSLCGETSAIRDILRENNGGLSPTSPLRRVPHYLETRLALSDVFHVLTWLKIHGDQCERHCAALCESHVERARKILCAMVSVSAD